MVDDLPLLFARDIGEIDPTRTGPIGVEPTRAYASIKLDTANRPDNPHIRYAIEHRMASLEHTGTTRTTRMVKAGH